MRMGKVTLDDKYMLERGQAFMTGIQALVRLPLVQARRDRAAGLNTAGFISGYRGSPLGGYDQELWRAKKHLDAHNIVFKPGINEDLAATALWGTQHVGLRPGAKVDGVFGIWYGKGPGVDRTMDVLRHANAAGTTKHGGVLCVAGDDHGAKSSTLPHQTDHNFMAAFMPFLYPASVQDYVEYGLLGLAMSRFAGAWVGFKATADTAESSGTVSLAPEQREIILPEFAMPEGGLGIRLGDVWREQDWRLQRYKGFAAQAFARANRIDRVIWDSPDPKLGIISTGKSYADVMQAMDELGIDEERAAAIGLRLYKVGMPWPLEPEGARHFCEGLEEVLVVEEKREFIEHQLKWQLYNWKENVRPRVVGKYDEKGEWLLPAENELTVGQIAHVIAARINKLHTSERIKERLYYFSERAKRRESYVPPILRKPYFCSGCPHNTSTKVPEGSRGLAGIGCHIMAMWMDRETDVFTQMGGEGVTWVGEAPFVADSHVFANLGDGTYFHSGLLAIRQAVAGDVNITYKILYNDAVAMTGGQHVDGQLSVPQIAEQLLAERVKTVVVVSDDVEKYKDPKAARLPAGVAVHHRDELERIQRDLRQRPGVSAIIYDQTCAAEKRRRRKRGTYPDPATRVFINDLVCEGCGDCSDQSNCVSVEPLETEWGRKRVINQSTCNKDYSCVKGFCPSFVTVHGGDVRKPGAVDAGDVLASLPEPEVAALGEDYNILVTGIGGTGVLTIGAILGMAAHIEGHASRIADMTGLAQKGGAVLSHVRIGRSAEHLRSPKIVTGGADLLLACDSVVAAGQAAIDLLHKERSAAIVNSHITPVADFVRNRNLDFREHQVEKAIRATSLKDATHFIPATEVATTLMGDAIATNMFVLGYAWQKGLVPLSRAAIEEAIKLNGVAVAFNLDTFHWGRLMAHDPAAVRAKLREGDALAEAAPPATALEDIVARRVDFLTAYQNAAYGARYKALAARVHAAEQAIDAASHALAEAVARSYFKLLAYKDEYEVARLYTSGEFKRKLDAQFAGVAKLKFHLSPPLLAKHDPVTGRPRKMVFPGWLIWPAFKLLARLKGLRGTAFDIFGKTVERRMERRLVAEYEAVIEQLLAGLAKDNLALAVEIARLPDMIRGFGPVKAANVEAALARQAELLARWPGRDRGVSSSMDSAA
ncbi:MAG: indolepyruvate ferredoxin oxidoreductase family protein [Pseudomonadota bacterium]